MEEEIKIEYDFLVSIQELLDIRKVIEKKLNSLTNKNFNEKYGFLKSIKKIIKYNIKNIYKKTFNSKIYVNVIFIGVFLNIKIDDIIECHVTDNNNIIICKKDNIKIIIIDKKEKVEIGKIVKVKILATQIKYNCDYINCVGKIIK